MYLRGGAASAKHYFSNLSWPHNEYYLCQRLGMWKEWLRARKEASIDSGKQRGTEENISRVTKPVKSLILLILLEAHPPPTVAVAGYIS